MELCDCIRNVYRIVITLRMAESMLKRKNLSNLTHEKTIGRK